MACSSLRYFVDALGGTTQEGIRVKASDSGREEADRREYREAAADVGRYRKHLRALTLGYLLKIALFRVRGEDDVLSIGTFA
jgi:hypothetical protein